MTLSWIHVHPEPGVLDGMLALGVLYGLAVGPLRVTLFGIKTFPRREVLWFISGWILLFLAIAGPLDEIGEKYLFSAHMLQHSLLIYPIPVMLLLGIPSEFIHPILNLEWIAPVFKLLSHPLTAGLVFNLTFYLWHVPLLYEAAIHHPNLHFLEHACFITTSLLAWWPIIPRDPHFPGLHPGTKLLYLIAMGIAQTPLFFILTFSRTLYYPTYILAPRITSLTPLQDQIAGGIVMKVSGMITIFIALMLVFYQWHKNETTSHKVQPR